jgi:hypothetical protein
MRVAPEDEAKMLATALLRQGQTLTPPEDSSHPLIPLLQYYADQDRLPDFAEALDTYLTLHGIDESRLLARVTGILSSRYFGRHLGGRFAAWQLAHSAEYSDMIRRAARRSGNIEAVAAEILNEASTRPE